MTKFSQFIFINVFLLSIIFSVKVFSQTSILKWQDGKQGCATLTFDDGSINQFKIAVPMLNERGIHATFFIITGEIPGSKYKPEFVGRSINEIVHESSVKPTNKNNLFERCSALYYLAQTGNYPEIKEFSDLSVGIGEKFENEKYQEVYSIVDSAFDKLRKTGRDYKIEYAPNTTSQDNLLTWDILEKLNKEGHEIANHTVSHPYMPLLSEPNILYEVQKCSEDIKDHIGVKRVFSIECPYGIDDKRVLEFVYPKFPFVRNGLKDNFIKEILRGETDAPVSEDKEYVQWQRGPLSNTTLDVMKGWIDTTVKDSVWLLLVIHGVEGIGWEAIPKERLQEYFDYIKKNENNLWIATFQDAYKYIRERMNSKVKVYDKQGSVLVTLSHNLDKQIYNLPLTLKTILPKGWKSANVQQGEVSSIMDVQKEGSDSFIKYRALPNSTNIIITKND